LKGSAVFFAVRINISSKSIIDTSMASINDVPDNILADGILSKLSLANRLIQQRTCRRWKKLIPFSDESVNIIPLIKEMLELWHKESEFLISDGSKSSP
jgi:hypothetical protein